jgi:ubiquinone/menaquinone biosynthesis C-methylase UbiE
MDETKEREYVDYKNKTIETYNKNAKELSEKYSKLTAIKERPEFQKFIELINGKKILDLGCGPGYNSVYFQDKGLEVTAIDLSEEMIKLCKEKGLNASVMDIENLKFQDKIFDGIWATTSLLHIPKLKLKNVIEKLNLILKDSGIIHICIKEGKGERLIEYSQNSSRFFSFWEEDEIIEFCKDYFSLIEKQKQKIEKDVYLKLFFKKNLSSINRP